MRKDPEGRESPRVGGSGGDATTGRSPSVEGGDRSATSDGTSAGAGQKGAGSSGASYASVGLQFAVAIVLSVYLGQWLDRRFGTAPWLLLLSLLLGAGGTFYSIYLKLMADLRREEEARRR